MIKHDYIFGGTDDRNTDVEYKVFGDLKKGDTFYWCVNVPDRTYCRIQELKLVSDITIDKTNKMMKFVSDLGGQFAIPAEHAIDSSFMFSDAIKCLEFYGSVNVQELICLLRDNELEPTNINNFLKK